MLTAVRPLFFSVSPPATLLGRLVPPCPLLAAPRSSIPQPNNIMYDKRVVRGNTYAAQILPAVRPPVPAQQQQQQQQHPKQRRWGFGVCVGMG